MTSDPKQPTPGEDKPYPPSFLDRFMDRVERLPVPYWLTYLALIFLQSALMHILAWIDGWLPAYQISPVLFLFPVWQWLPLAIMTYLDKAALEALSIFSPLLHLGETELERLKAEFTTLPARGVVLSGLAWGVVYVILNFLTFETLNTIYGMKAVFIVVILLEGLIAYLTGSAIYYHSLRLLGLVNRTVKMAGRLNIFQLDPVYVFSRLTSLVGVAWMLMLSLTLLLFPFQLVSGLVFTILVLQVVLALAAFILPLWFVHRRLVLEKRQLLSEFNRQVEATTGWLHRSLDRNDLGPVTQLKDVMLGLTAEQAMLNALSTWPWRVGTLSGFLSATVLPILLFITQLIIQRLVGK